MEQESQHPDAQAEPNPDDAAEIVSQLAQQRQEETRAEAQREAPPYVLAIEQSEVGYTLPPEYLPLAYVDFTQLYGSLRTKWGVSLDMSRVTLDPMLRRVSREQLAQMSEDELLQALLRTPDPWLYFEGGKYSVSEFEFVPIMSIRVNRETVLVAVRGISRVAEAVAAEVVEAIWAAAGAARPWSNLEPHVQRAGYATQIKVRLGAAFEDFLSQPLRDFLEQRMIGGEKYAAHIGHYLARDDLGPPPNAVAAYALDELQLRLVRFDPTTGLNVESLFKFSVTNAGDYNAGIVSISSELPYDVHLDCVGALLAELAA